MRFAFGLRNKVEQVGDPLATVPALARCGGLSLPPTKTCRRQNLGDRLGLLGKIQDAREEGTARVSTGSSVKAPVARAEKRNPSGFSSAQATLIATSRATEAAKQ